MKLHAMWLTRKMYGRLHWTIIQTEREIHFSGVYHKRLKISCCNVSEECKSILTLSRFSTVKFGAFESRHIGQLVLNR